MPEVHRLLVDLDSAALRRALDLVDAGPYESLSELITALVISGTAPRVGETSAPRHTSLNADAALERPPRQPAAQLATAPHTTRGALPFLTNRLNPLKVSVRVAATLSKAGEWPRLADFQIESARAARAVGVRLRAEDQQSGRRASSRRHVGYPVGNDEQAAADRFRFSFAIHEVGGKSAGPLAVLGLAEMREGRVVLTEPGWELALAPSPLLDGGEGTLSPREIEILRHRVKAATEEREAIADFLSAVHRVAGAQSKVDALLSTWHNEWSSDRAAAHRAAVLGRLGELGVLRVIGRGSRAQIELLDTDGFEGEKGHAA